MVGIVIVSHSAKIADGVRELAGQMAGRDQKIVAAGGMADGGIGTDALMIRDAVIAADSGDGVVILVDLGSAVLSAQTAIELLGEEPGTVVEISDAPLVEGAVSAAVQASIGSSLNDVVAAAGEARNIMKL